MGEKSARKESGKTAASKTLKEKRTQKADKKAANDRHSSAIDAAVTKGKR
jgi:hypothetical protein